MYKIRLILAITLCALITSGCNTAAQDTAAKVDQRSYVTIGALLGLSGDAAAYGVSQKKGIELAVREVNDSNYLAGNRELRLIVVDGGSSGDSAAAAISTLISDNKVVAIIGPTLSSQAFKADPEAQKNSIPVMAVSNTVPGITSMGNYIFRCSLPESTVIGGTIKAAASQLRIVKVAFLWGSNDDYTRAGYQAFRDAVEKNGLQVLADETFARGDADFKTQLEKIIAREPDAILVSALAREASPIIKQARALGYTGLIIGGNGFNSPDLITQAGRDAEGVMAGTAWNIGNTNPRNLAFISAFQKAYGVQPDQFAAQAYTGTWLIANAVRTGRSGDPGAIRNALAEIANFTTPLGSFSFDGSREPVHPSIVQIIRNGRFTVFNP
ncbi:MAG: ABC transporter substrate-binding protein [Chloroflexi bacterium]|nr:ABC transporter substrate-binding protein [Chloroflexota bacterium]